MMNSNSLAHSLLFGICLTLSISLGYSRFNYGQEQSESGTSWSLLSESYNSFIPEEAYSEYLGGKGTRGAGYAKWDVWHSYPGNSSDEDGGGLWLLGYAYPSYSEFSETVEEMGGSPEAFGNDGLSCAERIAIASIAIRINASNSAVYDHASFTADLKPKDSWKDDLLGYQYSFTQEMYMNEEVLGYDKPTVVHWAFANCKETCTPSYSDPYCGGSIDVYYSYHFAQVNYDTGDMNEFSFVFTGIFTLSVIASLIYACIILPAGCVVYVSLYVNKRTHFTVYLLALSIFSVFLGYFFYMVGMATVAPDGDYRYLSPLVTLGVFFRVTGYVGVSALYLCLAGGWTITRRKMRPAGRVRLAFFVTAYYPLALFAFALESSSEGSFGNQSNAPTVMVIIIGLLAWFRFLRMVKVTVSKWPEHTIFYRRLSVLASLHLLSSVIFGIVRPWIQEQYRVKALMWVSTPIQVVTHLVLVAMYHPRLLSGFPFHATIDDMRTYKLKKREERIVELLKRVESSESGNGSEINGVATGASNQAGVVSTISFTGGASYSKTSGNIERQKSHIDEVTGKHRPPSYFDKIQIRKLKEISLEVDAAVAHLNDYSVALNAVLDAVDTSTVENDAEFSRMVHNNTFLSDIWSLSTELMQMKMKMKEKTGAGGVSGSYRAGAAEGRSPNRNSNSRVDDRDVEMAARAQDEATSPGSGLGWREAGMANRPRALSGKEEQRRKQQAAATAVSRGPGYSALSLSGAEGGYEDNKSPSRQYDAGAGDSRAGITSPGGRLGQQQQQQGRRFSYRREETMEGASSDHDGDDSDDGLVRGGGSNKPSGGGTNEWSAARDYGNGAVGGTESEEALRSMWDDVDAQQAELQQRSGGGGGRKKYTYGSPKGNSGAPSSSSFSSPRAPPPSTHTPSAGGAASPYSTLDMASVKEHARNRMNMMNGGGGERDSDEEDGLNGDHDDADEDDDDDDPLMSSMRAHPDD